MRLQDASVVPDWAVHHIKVKRPVVHCVVDDPDSHLG